MVCAHKTNSFTTHGVHIVGNIDANTCFDRTKALWLRTHTYHSLAHFQYNNNECIIFSLSKKYNFFQLSMSYECWAYDKDELLFSVIYSFIRITHTLAHKHIQIYENSTHLFAHRNAIYAFRGHYSRLKKKMLFFVLPCN